MQGRRGEGENGTRGKGETGAASPEEGQTEREQAREAEGDTLLAKAAGEGDLGVDGACVLKGQGTQVTGQASRLQ